MPADFRVSITNAAGPGAYPVSSFTWLLLYEDPKDKAQSKAMVDFVKWALTDGQQFASQLGYAPLPADVVKQEMAALEKVKSRLEPAAGAQAPCRKDLGFRIGTGLFGALLILIVAAIGFELARQSMLSIQKFGLEFWRTSTWDPVAGQFGALPFIWGTLYSSVLALLIATPVAIGIAVFITELCPPWLRQPLVFLTELLAAIPSIVYGLWGIFVLVPAVRAFQVALPDVLRQLPIFSRSAARRRDAVGRADSRGDGRPVHLVGRARGAASRCRSRSVKRRTRSAPPGSRPSPPRSSTHAPASSAP